jgi:hypothetical protein
MTNYRADRVKTVTSGSSAVSSSAVWGVMKGTNGAGTLYLTSGSISIADLPVGQPFPCYAQSVVVSAGTVYLLS